MKTMLTHNFFLTYLSKGKPRPVSALGLAILTWHLSVSHRLRLQTGAVYIHNKHNKNLTQVKISFLGYLVQAIPNWVVYEMKIAPGNPICISQLLHRPLSDFNDSLSK